MDGGIDAVIQRGVYFTDAVQQLDPPEKARLALMPCSSNPELRPLPVVSPRPWKG